MKPLFMWAGGKSNLIKHYTKFLPNKVDTYYEPFFGGGAVFIYVIKNYSPTKIVVNDINDGIMNIYKTIQTDVDQFISIMSTYEEVFYLPLDKAGRKAFYYALRAEHAFDYQEWSSTEEAAVLYFLMKTGFNGIWQINKNTNGRYGTPSGLLNQSKVYDPANVREWNVALQGVELLCTDYQNIPYLDEENTLLYFDPPYRGGFTSYGQTFNDDDHRTLLDITLSMEKTTALLSNRDLGDGFFDGTPHIQIPVMYTAGRRKKTDSGFEAMKATEVLVFSKAARKGREVESFESMLY